MLVLIQSLIFRIRGMYVRIVLSVILSQIGMKGICSVTLQKEVVNLLKGNLFG